MRYTIRCAIVLCGLTLGCRQHPVQDTTKGPQATGTGKIETGHETPSETAHNGSSAESPTESSGGVVHLDAISLMPPLAGRKPAGSQFVTAEFSLPVRRR